MDSEVIKSKDHKPIIIIVSVIIGFLLLLIVASTSINYFAKKSGFFNTAGGIYKEIQQEVIPTDESILLELKEQILKLEAENAQLKQQLLDSGESVSNSSTSVKVTTNGMDTNITTKSNTCIEYSINLGEFKSNNCYEPEDYNNLVFYLNRYNAAVTRYNTSVARIDIVCSGSEFFEDNCKDAKDDKEQSEKDIYEYKNQIDSIISKY